MEKLIVVMFCLECKKVTTTIGQLELKGKKPNAIDRIVKISFELLSMIKEIYLLE